MIWIRKEQTGEWTSFQYQLLLGVRINGVGITTHLTKTNKKIPKRIIKEFEEALEVMKQWNEDYK